MSEISELASLPEISFIDNMSLAEVGQFLLDNYRTAYLSLTGEDLELPAADPFRLILQSLTLHSYQLMQYVETVGRAQLLNTSFGGYLDALAAFYGLTRKDATRATVRMKFTLSARRPDATPIPIGTRVKSTGGMYFSTTDYAEIPASELSVETDASAMETGTEHNGLVAGEISILVDPIPYMASVENVSTSTGGLDEESDDSLTKRVFLAPSSFSSAGPRRAYEYYARSWRSDLEDVVIESPEPCEITVTATMADTPQPRLLTDAEKESLISFLSADEIRPLGDRVSFVDPDEVEYAIALTYYVAADDQAMVLTIQEQVEKAVVEYQQWQRKIGRDINSTELVYRVRSAGACRVVLSSPSDRALSDNQLPLCVSSSVIYGGLE